MDKAFGALCAAAVASTTVLAGSTPTFAAAPAPGHVKPAQLDRGPDSRLPHLLGGAVVGGDRRVDVPCRHPTLLGASGDGYVVVSLVRRTWKTFHVGASPGPEVLA